MDATARQTRAAGPQEEPADILIVDDVPGQPPVFGTMLDDLQHNLVVVQSGQDALREMHQREFAVVLLAVNTPDLLCFEIAALIREAKSAAHTPIIFLTAQPDELQTTRAYALGAVDYILSPVMPEVLRSKVRAFVTMHALRRRAQRQAEERAAFLLHAGHMLGGAPDLTAGAQQLATLVVPRLAPLAVVLLADDTGPAEQALVVSAQPQQPAPAPPSPPLLLPVQTASLAPLLQTALRSAVDGRGRHTLPVAPAAPLSAASFGLDASPSEPLPAHAVTAVPLMAGQRVMGALLATDGGELDWQSLEALAGRAAAAFENARLVLSLQNQMAERRAAEAELQLAHQRHQAFVATLSHELRNPLAAIHSALEVVRRTAGPEPKLTWATDIMQRQLRQMTRLIEELLDVARIHQNKIVLAQAAVDLKAAIQQSVESAQPYLSERAQTLAVALPDEPVWLQGDAARLAQIVANLLHNASKYSAKGGLIELQCSLSDSGAMISVRDHGAGIAADLLPHIFDLFAQGARGPDRPHGGLGIGLTLAMRLARLHGGHIEAFSAGPGHGAEFRVHLPVVGR